jgi:peptidyl-prolyl cis-trans isomerase B (cyclophilin B)
MFGGRARPGPYTGSRPAGKAATGPVGQRPKNKHGRVDRVSSNRRKREYERRRYEDWQHKQAARRAKNLRTRRNAGVAASAVAVVVVILGALYFFQRSGSTSATASPTPSATAAVTPSSTASASQAADPSNPCPAPKVAPPAKPLSFPKAPDKATAQGKAWKLTLTTSCGPIVVTMDGAKASAATASMLLLGRSKFFDGSPCHRLVTAGIFVLQCGDPTGTGTGGPGFSYGPVENAPKDNVYKAGTVAMARQGNAATSMGSQFFLVYKDSPIPSDSAGGYTVFGTVSSGMDIVDKIAAGGVSGSGGGDGAPKRAISILSTSVAPG